MSETKSDLIITAGRVFCADTGLDGPGGVAVKDGRITASGPHVSGEAVEKLDFPDAILLPGLVDLHTHPAPAAWRFGSNADAQMLPRGSTTVLSQGDAGAATWPEYRDTIIHEQDLLEAGDQFVASLAPQAQPPQRRPHAPTGRRCCCRWSGAPASGIQQRYLALPLDSLSRR